MRCFLLFILSKRKLLILFFIILIIMCIILGLKKPKHELILTNVDISRNKIVVIDARTWRRRSVEQLVKME